MSHDIAILGATGELGTGLAARLAASGRRVALGSRDAERARDAAAALDGDVTGLVNEEAAAGAPVVFLCVPFAAQAPTLEAVAGVMSPGAILVDATVPLAPAVGGKPTQLVGLWQGSAAEQAQELVGPEIAVVAALHTVSGAMLADLGTQLEEDVLVCGRKAARETIVELLDGLGGLRAVDCGSLDRARIIEALTPLLIGINRRYKVHAGVRITGLDL